MDEEVAMIKIRATEMDHSGSGERDLWAAVLHQAMNAAGKKRDSKNREEARRFILSPDAMFLVICDILEINPEAAQERIVAKWGDYVSA